MTAIKFKMQTLQQKQEFIRFKKRQQDIKNWFEQKRSVSMMQRQRQQQQDGQPAMDEAINLISTKLDHFKQEHQLLVQSFKCLDLQVDQKKVVAAISHLLNSLVDALLSHTEPSELQFWLLVTINKILTYNDQAYIEIMLRQDDFLRCVNKIIATDPIFFNEFHQGNPNNLILCAKLLENLLIDAPEYVGNFIVQTFHKDDNIIVLYIQALGVGLDNTLNLNLIRFFYHFLEFYQNQNDFQNLYIVVDLFYNLIDITMVQVEQDLLEIYSYVAYKMFKLANQQNHKMNFHQKFLILISHLFKTLVDPNISSLTTIFYYAKLVRHFCRYFITTEQELVQFTYIGLIEVVVSILDQSCSLIQKQGLKILNAILNLDPGAKTQHDIFFTKNNLATKSLTLFSKLNELLLQSCKEDNIVLLVDSLGFCKSNIVASFLKQNLLFYLNRFLVDGISQELKISILVFINNLLIVDEDEANPEILGLVKLLKQSNFTPVLLTQLVQSGNKELQDQATQLWLSLE